MVEGHEYADNEDLGSLAFPYPAYWQKNYAPAGFGRTNNVEIFGVMALPFGQGQPWPQTGPDPGNRVVWLGATVNF